MVTVPQETHPGLVRARSRHRAHSPRRLCRHRTHAQKLRPIQVVPLPQALQALALLARNRPVSLRAHVKQEAPAARNDVHQVTDGTRPAQVLMVPLGAVVPERQAHASAILPGLPAGLQIPHVLILAGQVVRVNAAVTVIRDPLGASRVEVLEERAQTEGAEILPLVGPIDVVPHDVGGVAVDQVAHVHEAVTRVIRVLRPAQVLAVILGQDGPRGPIVPVQATGVVQANAQSLRPRGIRDARHEVDARTPANRVARARLRGVPQGHTVVVLRRQHRVAGARTAEETHPLRRVPRIRVPRVQERVVGGSPIQVRVAARRRRPRDTDRVEVPLRV